MNTYKLEVKANGFFIKGTCAFCFSVYEPSDVRYIFYVNGKRHGDICDACANSPADAARRCREGAKEVYKEFSEIDYDVMKMADGLEGNAAEIENFAPDVYPTREQVEQVRKELADSYGGDE